MQLEIKNIGKCYGEKEALKELTLRLSPGIYGLLGPNGAGKSTLMKLICMLIEPTTGTILFDGKDIRTERKNFLKRLGYMPQQHCLYPEFRVEEYLHYIGTLKGMNKKSVEQSSEELLKKVRLLDVRTQKIRTLSGGMQQRLMFAQALLDNPKVLILDEPTAGLDPKERAYFRNIIAEMSKDKIIIISTHIVSDIEYISDQVLIMKKGKFILQGSAEELLKEVKNEVWSCKIPNNQWSNFERTHCIANSHAMKEFIEARVISASSPIEGAITVEPTLEDLYLKFFSDEIQEEGECI